MVRFNYSGDCCCDKAGVVVSGGGDVALSERVCVESELPKLIRAMAENCFVKTSEFENKSSELNVSRKVAFEKDWLWIITRESVNVDIENDKPRESPETIYSI